MGKIIKTERDEQLVVHYMMLTRQMTRLSDCFMHIIRLPTQESGTHGRLNLDFIGYRAYAKTELADIICQIKKLCKILELNFNMTLIMGLKRDEEKKAEYLKKHPNDEWI